MTTLKVRCRVAKRAKFIQIIGAVRSDRSSMSWTPKRCRERFVFFMVS